MLLSGLILAALRAVVVPLRLNQTIPVPNNPRMQLPTGFRSRLDSITSIVNTSLYCTSSIWIRYLKGGIQHRSGERGGGVRHEHNALAQQATTFPLVGVHCPGMTPQRLQQWRMLLQVVTLSCVLDLKRQTGVRQWLEGLDHDVGVVVHNSQDVVVQPRNLSPSTTTPATRPGQQSAHTSRRFGEGLGRRLLKFVAPR